MPRRVHERIRPGQRAVGGALTGGADGAGLGTIAGGGNGALIGCLAGSAVGAGTGYNTTPSGPATAEDAGRG